MRTPSRSCRRGSGGGPGRSTPPWIYLWSSSVRDDSIPTATTALFSSTAHQRLGAAPRGVRKGHRLRGCGFTPFAGTLSPATEPVSAFPDAHGAWVKGRTRVDHAWTEHSCVLGDAFLDITRSLSQYNDRSAAALGLPRADEQKGTEMTRSSLTLVFFAVQLVADG